MHHTTPAFPERRPMRASLRLGASASLALAAAVTGVIGAFAPRPAHAAVPTITTFACPLDNGGGRFYCFIDYASDSNATIAWSGFGTVVNDPGHSDFFGHCAINSYLTVTVTVTNATGTTSRTSRSFRCNGGQVIL